MRGHKAKNHEANAGRECDIYKVYLCIWIEAIRSEAGRQSEWLSLLFGECWSHDSLRSMSHDSLRAIHVVAVNTAPQNLSSVFFHGVGDRSDNIILQC